MQLKDAMRETCLNDLAQAWYNLLQAYQHSNPDLAAAVLNTLERYVNWIDVGLVVNARLGGSSSLRLSSSQDIRIATFSVTQCVCADHVRAVLPF